VIFNISSTAEAGSKEQDPASIYPLTPRRTLRALGPFGTVRAFRALRALRAFRAFRTLRAVRTLRTVRALGSIATLGPIASFGALRTVRPLGPRWSLYLRRRPFIGNLGEHGSHVARGNRARGHQRHDDS
jgi:hypothetical protein